MLACDGRVTTLWAWASVKTRPAAASRSRLGVATLRLPAKPSASARRVSMVIRTTSGGDGRNGGRGRIWQHSASRIAVVEIASAAGGSRRRIRGENGEVLGEGGARIAPARLDSTPCSSRRGGQQDADRAGDSKAFLTQHLFAGGCEIRGEGASVSPARLDRDSRPAAVAVGGEDAPIELAHSRAIPHPAAVRGGNARFECGSEVVLTRAVNGSVAKRVGAGFEPAPFAAGDGYRAVLPPAHRQAHAEDARAEALTNLVAASRSRRRLRCST